MVAGVALAGLLLFLCLRHRKQSQQDRPLREKTSTVPMSCGPFPERNGYENLEDSSRVRRMEALHTSAGGIMSSPEITPPRTERSSTRRVDTSSAEENNALSSPEGGSPLMLGTLPPPPPLGATYGGSVPPSPTRHEGLREAALGAAAIGAAAAAASRGNNGGKRGSRTSTTLSSMSPAATSEGSEAASVSVVSDHYSSNQIVRQSDVVALWSYTPRLADEMALERGDVVRIENLYDDGWALGRKLKTKVWDLGADERSTERDSGIGTSQRESTSTTHRISLEQPPEPPGTGTSRSSEKGKEKEEVGSIKAFPMVCVCHRDAWAEVLPEIEEDVYDRLLHEKKRKVRVLHLN